VIRHLGPPPVDGLVAAVLAQAQRDFGATLEPFLLHAAVPEVMAAGWASFRETMLAPGRLARPLKETIAVGVSRANRCRYCVDAHALALHALGAGAVEAELARGGPGAVADRRAAAVAAWAEATRTPGSPLLASPPFTAEELPLALATAVCFHYINRMATIFLGETPLPLAAPSLRRPLLAVAARAFARRFRRRLEPGEGLALLPEEPPPLPHWAAGAPLAGAAVAALGAAVDGAAHTALPPPATTLATRALAAWRGEDPPLGTAWLDEPTAHLAPADRAATRLALLAALAPHRAGAAEIAAFRAHHPGDRPLVAVTAWASHAAARRVAEWLAPA
jgi:AhpD family alkylhydroperoxidase